MNEFLPFIRTERKRSIVVTIVRIELFCKKPQINVGCYDVFRVCPRIITE